MSVRFEKSSNDFIRKRLKKELFCIQDYSDMNIPGNLKLRKAKTVYGEDFYYTDQSGISKRFFKLQRLHLFPQLCRVKYSKQLVGSVVSFEYELNELWKFGGVKDFPKVLKTMKILLLQMEQLKEPMILFLTVFNSYDLQDKNVCFSICFIKYRKGFEKAIRWECRRADFAISVNCPEGICAPTKSKYTEPQLETKFCKDGIKSCFQKEFHDYMDDRKIKVFGKLKLRKAKTVYGDDVYYTNADSKRRISYRHCLQVDYYKELVSDVVEFEYEFSRINFVGLDTLPQVIQTMKILLYQMEHSKERALLLFRAYNYYDDCSPDDGNSYNLNDDDIRFSVCFVQYRIDFENTIRTLLKKSTFSIAVHCPNTIRADIIIS